MYISWSFAPSRLVSFFVASISAISFSPSNKRYLIATCLFGSWFYMLSGSIEITIVKVFISFFSFAISLLSWRFSSVSFYTICSPTLLDSTLIVCLRVSSWCCCLIYCISLWTFSNDDLSCFMLSLSCWIVFLLSSSCVVYSATSFA